MDTEAERGPEGQHPQPPSSILLTLMLLQAWVRLGLLASRCRGFPHTSCAVSLAGQCPRVAPGPESPRTDAVPLLLYCLSARMCADPMLVGRRDCCPRHHWGLVKNITGRPQRLGAPLTTLTLGCAGGPQLGSAAQSKGVPSDLVSGVGVGLANCPLDHRCAQGPWCWSTQGFQKQFR